MTERIAFIGFGEAGQTIGRGLLAQGAQLCTDDILFDDPADAGRLKQAAESLGVATARDHADAVGDAEIVFLAVTASSSLQATLSCLPGLKKGQLFLDINSVSPQRKIETAARVAAIEPLMAAATAARQQWLADLGVKERLGGKKTEDRAELIDAIRDALRKGPG